MLAVFSCSPRGAMRVGAGVEAGTDRVAGPRSWLTLDDLGCTPSSRRDSTIRPTPRCRRYAAATAPLRRPLGRLGIPIAIAQEASGLAFLASHSMYADKKKAAGR